MSSTRAEAVDIRAEGGTVHDIVAEIRAEIANIQAMLTRAIAMLSAAEQPRIQQKQ